MQSIWQRRFRTIGVALDVVVTLVLLSAATVFFFVPLGNEWVSAGLVVIVVGSAAKRLVLLRWRRDVSRVQIIKGYRLFGAASVIGGCLVAVGAVLLNHPVGWVFAALSFAWTWIWFWTVRDLHTQVNRLVASGKPEKSS